MKAAQLCPTLCDPMDYTVHGILQARILEWVAFPFSRVSSQPSDRTQVSHIRLPSIVQLVKNPPAMQQTSSNPGSGRSAGEGIGYPLQYSWASLVAQLVKNPQHWQHLNPLIEPSSYIRFCQGDSPLFY